MSPTVIALSIDNRVGALAEVTRILGAAGVNIAGLQLGRGPDKQNLRITVDHPERAIVALAKFGFQAKRSEVVSLRVRNTPGAIAEATDRLAKEGVNIEAVFLTAGSSRKKVHLVMQVDDPAAARKALGPPGEEE